MGKKFNIFLFFIVFLLFFVFVSVNFVKAELISAPTLIEPNQNTITEKVKPIITGLIKSGSLAHIYIDGVYDGRTEIVTHKSGTANFAYKPFLNLKTEKHSVFAITENELGEKSGKSNVLNFNIEKPLPAPYLLKPIVNNKTDNNKPFIVGLSKNDLMINVFIDHKLFGKFNVKNNKSGTANFAYKPFIKLSAGKHFVYTTAIDSRGKESKWSNVIYFNVLSIIEDDKKIVKKIYIDEKINEKIDKKIENKNKIDKKSTSTDQNIVDILTQKTSSVEEKTGLINESREKQSKLSLNLVIFILFLIAIIAWIFWINKELIKEKREQNKKDNN